jgi:ferredoxin
MENLISDINKVYPLIAKVPPKSIDDIVINEMDDSENQDVGEDGNIRKKVNKSDSSKQPGIPEEKVSQIKSIYEKYKNISQFSPDRLKITFIDRCIFIGVTFMLRLVSLSLVYWGLNSNLINKQQGSFFFIAELIIDIDLQYDGAIKDYCGTCTKCIDACPTSAIIEPYVVDGSKCISYFTIELKEAIPNDFKGKMDNWAFGCDVCQDVCPWNRFSTPTQEKAFEALPGMLEYSLKDWEEISETQFQILFKHSALKRAKYSGIRRNLEFIKSSI